jgi:NADH dehydrogenase [ubiquinone] 1 alpha subcomplex assembly factor 7
MTRLGDHLAQLIASEGPISIAEFMRTALTARELGYYMHGDPFGVRGDFVTAPEISQAFGELIGLWAVAVWEQMGSPARFSLIELGPGRGTLMRDALRAARVRPAFGKAADVALVEISPSLRERQREALAREAVRSLSWLDDFAAADDQPLIVVANEFFDALPMRQFVATSKGWCERLVGLAGDGALAFALSPPLPQEIVPRTLARSAEGAVFELAPARDGLAMRVGAAIAANGGAALVVDYGFSGPAIGDTLQAMKAHRFVSVLEEPGHVDLTSHVDFTALAAGFAAGGADVYGPLAQSALLERLGGRERTAALAVRATPEQRKQLDDGYARLTEPQQMGSLFKALAVASPGLLPPGFGPHERH